MSRQRLKEKIAENDRILRQVKKRYYSERFYEFNRDILGWPDIYEPLHRRVCDFVTDNIDRKKLLILLPRGTFKSSIITVGYTLWSIAKNPETRILIANATHEMSVSFLGQIKRHLQRNEDFKAIYGDLTATADSWRENRISVAKDDSYKTKEPTVWAFGAGGNLVGSHFDLAILDDLVNRDNITTKEQIEKIKNFYKDTLDLVDADKKGHKKVIVIGTTWHWDDLYAWIQDPKEDIGENFEVIRMPAYEGEWGEGDLLFPDKLGWKQLEDLKREQGLAHFSAQYMLDPIPEEQQTFKGPFRDYDPTDLRGLNLNKFITVDPAVSEKKQADFSAMVCVGVDKNNDWYILDIWREQVQPKRLIDQIFYWYEKWKPISVGIETTAYQKALKFFIQDEMRRRNRFIPLKELGHTDRSKEERIRGLQPRYETGSIFHPQRQSVQEVEYLEDELMRFPLGRNDDIVDALASQLELAYPARKGEERTNRLRKQVYPA